MFDTHCHLNFSAFNKNLTEVIAGAKAVGVRKILVPSTKLKNSLKAVEIAEKYEGIYVGVGIHPHHIYDIKVELNKFLPQVNSSRLKNRDSDIHLRKNLLNSTLLEIEKLLNHKKVVAVGEVGLDRHEYEKTVYQNYQVSPDFFEWQKLLLVQQIKLALKYDRSLILHNREASQELLKLLIENWDEKLAGKTVFHCCEPNLELLDFAKKHQIYLGVDGDVTFSPEKQDFVKLIPLELLVLETDSPLLLPEPLRSKKLYPNKPENLPIILRTIAGLLKTDLQELTQSTTENACRLFSLPED